MFLQHQLSAGTAVSPPCGLRIFLTMGFDPLSGQMSVGIPCHWHNYCLWNIYSNPHPYIDYTFVPWVTILESI